MPCMVELVCVDPNRIAKVWPHVAHLIHNTVKRTNLSHTLDIELKVLHGKGLGPMAQDVEKDTPDAVHEINGFKAVNYKAATEKAVNALAWGC
jgi:hypothetical protein